MQSILKTFRLPSFYAQFLEERAKKKNTSQTEIILESLQKMMESENQWQNDLQELATNQEYQKEQINLAEEYYEQMESR